MNNEHTNEHASEKEYTETARQLSNALHQLIRQYDGDPDRSGVQENKDGSYKVFIKGDIPEKEMELWFKDEIELSGWVLGMNRNG